MLDKIKAEIQEVLDAEGDSENAKAQALALMWVLELFDKYAEQEPTIGQLFSCEEVEELRNKIWKQVEQEPCDDAVRREMALEKMADYVASGYADSAEDFEEYSRIICQLPSVRPQEQKTWKWADSKENMQKESE